MKRLEKRINEKAQERFENDLRELKASICRNPILLGIKIYLDAEKKESGPFLRLRNAHGHCPSTDLFISNKLLEKKTNYFDLKEEIIKKYEAEEMDIFLNKVGMLREYLEIQ